jgi:hypothetical protein
MSSSPKMGFIIANLDSNNLEERRPSKWFFIGAISKPHLCVKFISFASFALHCPSFNLEDENIIYLHYLRKFFYHVFLP